MKSIFLLLGLAIFVLSIILSGCFGLPGPSVPIISFTPSQPVAGQTVTVEVQSNDAYSNLTCALSVDGQQISLQGTNDVFTGNWLATLGLHTFVATVTDSYNHSLSTVKRLNVGLPNPPAIYDISVSPPDPQGGQILTFTFSATSVIGLSSEDITLDSNPLPLKNVSGTFISTSTAVPGNHIVGINVSDSMGTSSSTSVSFCVSNYPYPIIKNISWTPQYPTISDKSVVFSVTGYDPIGFTPFISVDGMPLQTVFSSSTPGSTLNTTTYIATWTIVPGYHTVNFMLEDAKGWFNEQNYHIEVTPQVQSMSILAGITPQTIQHDQAATVTAVVYGYYPPMKSIRLYVDKILYDTVYSTDTLVYRFIPSDGFHTVEVIAQDGVGSVASSTFNFTVQYNPSAYPPLLNVNFTPCATVGIAKILSVNSKATAPDAVINDVEFENMLSSSQIGLSSVGNNGIYAISWIPNEAGVVPIKIIATDSNGIQSSTMVNVNVSPNYINNDGPIIYPVFKSTIEQSSIATLGASVISKDKLADVEMWIDNTPLTPSISATGIYTIQWIASATGTHVFKVYAQDIFGRTTTSDFYFYVYPGSLPMIQVYATPTSIYLGGKITFNATILQSQSAINYVDFYVGENEIGSSDTPPYTIQWTPKNTGSHTVTVKAVNMYGNSGYANAYFNVFKDTIPPELEISVPSTASTGQNLSITAKASDAISGINYLNLQIYSSNAPQPYPDIIPILYENFKSNSFVFNWSPSQNATYTIYVMAYDNAGNMTKKFSTLSVRDYR